MSDLEKEIKEDVVRPVSRLTATKRLVNDEIHEIIHVLHENSKKLEDLDPINDGECLRALEKEINKLINYMRIRHSLDS